MRRTVFFAVGWMTAAVIAGVIAWQGVAVVGNQVTTSRPAALDQEDIEARLADRAPDRSDPDPSAVAPSTSRTTEGEDPGTDDTVAEAGVPDPQPAVSPPALQTTDSTPTSAPPPPATTTSTSPEPSEVRTYQLVGGTAALRFSPSGVSVEFATPNAGFSVEIEPENGNGIKVEFESGDHRSRVEGWWDGGPRERVREESESRDSSSEDD